MSFIRTKLHLLLFSKLGFTLTYLNTYLFYVLKMSLPSKCLQRNKLSHLKTTFTTFSCLKTNENSVYRLT